MDSFMIPVVIMFMLIFLSRMVSLNATKKLDAEKKAALVDLFTKDQVYNIAILVAIIIAFFLMMQYELLDPVYTYMIYAVAILAFVIVTAYIAYKKLKDHNFPDFYIRSYIISTSIRFIGILVVFILIQTWNN